MHAIILAGGEGTRLKPLTDDRPKPMIEIAGKPMLEHQIRQLKKAGVEDIIILESYYPEKIRGYFQDGKKFGVNINHLVLPKELQSSGAIKKALEHIPEQERDILVLYGDIISNVDLGAVIKRHRERGTFLITAVTVEGRSPYGEWDVDEAGKARSFKEKPARETNTGIFVVNRGISDFLIDGKDFFGGVVSVIAREGGGIFQTYKHQGFWRDIADLNNLTEAENARQEWEILAFSPEGNPSNSELLH